MYEVHLKEKLVSFYIRIPRHIIIVQGHSNIMASITPAKMPNASVEAVEDGAKGQWAAFRSSKSFIIIVVSVAIFAVCLRFPARRRL